MPLNQNLLAQEMLAATYNATDAYVAQKKLGDAISKHIMTNALVNFTWSGIKIIYPFPPDTVVSGTGKITNIKIMLRPDKSKKVGQGLKTMAMQITQGVKMGMYNLNPPWATSPGTLASIPPLTLTVSYVANREQSMLRIATEIVTWIKAYVPSIPCSGLRTSFIGVGVPINIM